MQHTTRDTATWIDQRSQKLLPKDHQQNRTGFASFAESQKSNRHTYSPQPHVFHRVGSESNHERLQPEYPSNADSCDAMVHQCLLPNRKTVLDYRLRNRSVKHWVVLKTLPRRVRPLCRFLAYHMRPRRELEIFALVSSLVDLVTLESADERTLRVVLISSQSSDITQ